ncbi:hypothetical protein RFI_04838 [Reticulomyxa filosa]|uniref:Uncharacterized protein n=1 Tax=Reticulomyxa filosa TaxID=46433 RepID=X6P2H2_RETFI|nr:hypothetical protein RFI_04838 [Reticulomyxa filosa]|eukprot:ETO32279.1 hypothetical protein RFI_04838 [Reticulomyxa filosa]
MSTLINNNPISLYFFKGLWWVHISMKADVEFLNYLICIDFFFGYNVSKIWEHLKNFTFWKIQTNTFRHFGKEFFIQPKFPFQKFFVAEEKNLGKLNNMLSTVTNVCFFATKKKEKSLKLIYDQKQAICFSNFTYVKKRHGNILCSINVASVLYFQQNLFDFFNKTSFAMFLERLYLLQLK